MEVCGARPCGARVNALANLLANVWYPTMNISSTASASEKCSRSSVQQASGDLLVVPHHLFGEREGRHFARCELRALAVPSERGELRLRKSHSHADGVTDVHSVGARVHARHVHVRANARSGASMRPQRSRAVCRTPSATIRAGRWAITFSGVGTTPNMCSPMRYATRRASPAVLSPRSWTSHDLLCETWTVSDLQDAPTRGTSCERM